MAETVGTLYPSEMTEADFERVQAVAGQLMGVLNDALFARKTEHILFGVPEMEVKQELVPHSMARARLTLNVDIFPLRSSDG